MRIRIVGNAGAPRSAVDIRGQSGTNHGCSQAAIRDALEHGARSFLAGVGEGERFGAALLESDVNRSEVWVACELERVFGQPEDPADAIARATARALRAFGVGRLDLLLVDELANPDSLRKVLGLGMAKGIGIVAPAEEPAARIGRRHTANATPLDVALLDLPDLRILGARAAALTGERRVRA